MVRSDWRIEVSSVVIELLGYYPRSADWARFERYAKYVRMLELEASAVVRFQMLFATRPQQSILPNLQKLVCSSNRIKELVESSVIFMTDRVTDFKVTLPNSPCGGAYFDSYVHFIGSRMPFLQHLEIVRSGNVADLEAGIHDLLRSCRFLVTVTLPKYWVTSQIFEILAGRTIKAIKSNDSGDWNENVFDPHLVDIPNPFSVLIDMTLGIHYDEMILLITSSLFPMLQYIQVISPENPTRNEVSMLADALSKRFPDVIELNLGVMAVPRNSSNDQQTVDAGITLADLKPLLVLSELKKLSISNHYPLNLTDHDIETLASAFPAIQSLFLNEKPSYRLESELSWNVLYSISAKCPLLRELGLYMRLGPSPLEIGDLHSAHRLRFLELFSVGFTPTTDEIHADIFLSFFLPPDCSLDYGGMDDAFDEDPWDFVGNVLPRIQKALALKDMSSPCDLHLK